MYVQNCHIGSSIRPKHCSKLSRICCDWCCWPQNIDEMAISNVRTKNNGPDYNKNIPPERSTSNSLLSFVGAWTFFFSKLGHVWVGLSNILGSSDMFYRPYLCFYPDQSGGPSWAVLCLISNVVALCKSLCVNSIRHVIQFLFFHMCTFPVLCTYDERSTKPQQRSWEKKKKEACILHLNQVSTPAFPSEFARAVVPETLIYGSCNLIYYITCGDQMNNWPRTLYVRQSFEKGCKLLAVSRLRLFINVALLWKWPAWDPFWSFVLK